MADDSMAAEIAAHRRSDWIWPDEEAVCDFCRHPWPCLVRRLADELDAANERYAAQMRHLQESIEKAKDYPCPNCGYRLTVACTGHAEPDAGGEAP